MELGQRSPKVKLRKPLKWLVNTIWTLLFLVKTRDRIRSPEVKDRPSGVERGQNAKFPQEFSKLSSGVTRGQKAKFPKNSQDRQGITKPLDFLVLLWAGVNIWLSSPTRLITTNWKVASNYSLSKHDLWPRVSPWHWWTVHVCQGAILCPSVLVPGAPSGVWTCEVGEADCQCPWLTWKV